MSHVIIRTYVHRQLGHIGQVELKVDVKSATLDGEALPPASVDYLLNFALQSLQDAYAGAKTAAEAGASWLKKRDAILAGTIGVRTASGEEPIDKFIRDIVRKNLAPESKTAYDALEGAADKKAYLLDRFDGAAEGVQKKIRTVAQQALEEEIARKAEAAKLAGEFSL